MKTGKTNASELLPVTEQNSLESGSRRMMDDVHGLGTEFGRFQCDTPSFITGLSGFFPSSSLESKRKKRICFNLERSDLSVEVRNRRSRVLRLRCDHRYPLSLPRL
jgi:hypothetical protein